ncbi:MAG: alpha/beta fold hydrolase [Streptosporangiales bacterium]|nr:alpha/beta fold hydrolase [Streptosporangiales bacterium]
MEHITSKDGTMIAVEKTGDGPAVVLVDGAYTYRAIDQFPASLAELLAPRFTVAHYERRGRGESGDTAPYAVEREIEDLAAVIDAVGGSASVLGMSSGSVLALQAAVRGVAVERLAMWEPPFVVDDSRPPLPDDYVARLDALIAAGRRGDAMEYALTTAVGLPVDDVRAMRAEPFFALMEAVAHTAAYDGRVMADTMSGRPLAFERWAGFTIPALVLVGEKSDEFWQVGTRAFAHGMPTVRHRSIDTLAEEAHAVSPAALAPVLEEFFTIR